MVNLDEMLYLVIDNQPRIAGQVLERMAPRLSHASRALGVPRPKRTSLAPLLAYGSQDLRAPLCSTPGQPPLLELVRSLYAPANVETTNKTDVMSCRGSYSCGRSGGYRLSLCS